MGEELAVIEGGPRVIADALETAALGGDGNDPHEEMFVEIDADALETPASSVDATQRSYCTLSAELFDSFSVFESTAALFPVVEVLDWLEWFGDESVAVSFIGDPRVEMASQLRIAGGESTVSVACTADPSVLEDIEIALPDRFDGSVFLDAEGDPVSTRIETTAAELSRLVGAVERCAGPERYPLTVTAGEVHFGVTGDETQAEGRLDATVEGPGFARQYGPGFGRVVRSIEGTVTLWTGPEQPLAMVTTGPGQTYRHVVTVA